MSKVTQKDILKDRLDQEGVQILTQVAVHPPQTLPTGDPVGVRGQYQGSSGIVYDPLTGEDKPIAVVSQNGKVVAETAFNDRVFFPTYTITEVYEDMDGNSLGENTTRVLKHQPPILYGQPGPVEGYICVGYKIGEEELVEGSPAGLEIVGDIMLTIVYAANVTVTEDYELANGTTVLASTSTVIPGAITLDTYSKVHPEIPGYVYSGYKVGAGDLVPSADPTEVIIVEDTTVTFIYVAVTDVTTDAYETQATDDTVTLTLTGGTFKEGNIVAADFEFGGTNAEAMALGTFTRTSDTVVTITDLTLAASVDNTITVLAETQATQASSAAAVASKA